MTLRLSGVARFSGAGVAFVLAGAMALLLSAMHPAPAAEPPALGGAGSGATFSVTAGDGPGGGGKGAPAFSCGGRRTCRQMQSCLEARFHFQQCGMTQLDRDGDGVPCETLCGPSGTPR